jgi:release factor glutamine methyltransferase
VGEAGLALTGDAGPGSTPDRAAAPPVWVVDRLARAGCVAADAEAAELVSSLGSDDEGALDAAIRRREDGEPLAWIVGGMTFCDRRIAVDPGVYVPRTQTEDLARRAAARLPAGGRAIDLCTGSGAVAAHLRAARPAASAIGIDRDPRAAACAARNGVTAVVADLATCIAGAGTFDVVTSVPPYVPTDAVALLPPDTQRHEPRGALDGGEDGLDVALRVVAAAERLLHPGGWLLIELGGDQDALLVPALSGFTNIEPWHDDHGDLRGLEAQRI